MKDMTSREILDAFARGLEEATRPFRSLSQEGAADGSEWRMTSVEEGPVEFERR